MGNFSTKYLNVKMGIMNPVYSRYTGIPPVVGRELGWGEVSFEFRPPKYEYSALERIIKNANMTHLAALRGGNYDTWTHFSENKRKPGIKTNLGHFYLGYNKVVKIDHITGRAELADITHGLFSESEAAIRPYITFDSKKEFEHYTRLAVKGENGKKYVTLGTLPLYAPSIEIIDELENHKDRLEETDSSYTLPGSEVEAIRTEGLDYLKRRKLKTYKVFKYNGKRYIRFDIGEHDLSLDSYDTLFRDLAHDINMEGRYERPYIWLEEAPVWWIVSEEKQILLARDCLVAGIEYDQIDSYLRKHLLKELLALDPQEELENERKIARAEEKELLRDAAKNARRIREIHNQLGESTDVVELPEDKGIQIVFKKNGK